MPKTRNEAALEVRDAFMPAESAAEIATARAARCLAVLVEARMKAKVAPTAGADVIELLTRATTKMSEARADMMLAHEKLADLRYELGIATAFGDDECPPNSQAAHVTLAALSVVG